MSHQSSRQEERSRAAIDAARLLMRVEEEPNNEELAAELSEWLAANPEHPVAWFNAVETCELIDASGEEPSPETVVSYEEPSGLALREKSEGVNWGVRSIFAIAACVGLLFIMNSVFRTQAAFEAETAESTTVELEDQSVVILAPESAMDLEFSDAIRVVELLRGQAFFDVVSEPDRPFRVEAGEYVVEVLGTAFDVNLGEGFVSVAVEHGSVSVRSRENEREIRLSSGEVFRGLQNGEFEAQNHRFDEASAWRSGRLIIRDERLVDAVDQLSRYLKADVLIEGVELREMSVSGVFNAAKPIVALEAMASSVDGFLEKTSDTLITIRPRP